jgi:hypothetical protein
VVVVGLLQLVLDDDRLAGELVVALQIEAEVSDRVLGDLQHEVHAQQIVEDIDVP